jgi:hypothetical protein
MVMVICTMKVHDVDDPTQFIIVDGCSAMGALDKFGTGQCHVILKKVCFLKFVKS